LNIGQRAKVIIRIKTQSLCPTLAFLIFIPFAFALLLPLRGYEQRAKVKIRIKTARLESLPCGSGTTGQRWAKGHWGKSYCKK